MYDANNSATDDGHDNNSFGRIILILLSLGVSSFIVTLT